MPVTVVSETVNLVTKVTESVYVVANGVGASGPQGPQGIPGTPGATGSKGDKGDTGDIGPNPDPNTGTLSLARVVFPNAVLTYEANPDVGAIQLGDDGPSPREHHISTADRVGATGSGAGLTINPGAAEGPNQPGVALRLGPGRGSGNNGSGPVVVLTGQANVGGLATDLNTQSDSFYFWGSDLEKAITPASNGAQDLGYPALQMRNVYLSGQVFVDGAPMIQTFIQPTQPTGVTGAYQWIQTGLGTGGADTTIWIEDGT